MRTCSNVLGRRRRNVCDVVSGYIIGANRVVTGDVINIVVERQWLRRVLTTQLGQLGTQRRQLVIVYLDQRILVANQQRLNFTDSRLIRIVDSRSSIVGCSLTRVVREQGDIIIGRHQRQSRL